MTDHDAELRVVTPYSHGKSYGPDRLVAWSWTDGRRTVSPDEHEAIRELTGEAEERYGLSEYDDTPTIVGQVWMNDDETVDRVEWVDE